VPRKDAVPASVTGPGWEPEATQCPREPFGAKFGQEWDARDDDSDAYTAAAAAAAFGAGRGDCGAAGCGWEGWPGERAGGFAAAAAEATAGAAAAIAEAAARAAAAYGCVGEEGPGRGCDGDRSGGGIQSDSVAAPAAAASGFAVGAATAAANTASAAGNANAGGSGGGGGLGRGRRAVRRAESVSAPWLGQVDDSDEVREDEKETVTFLWLMGGWIHRNAKTNA
jgi:hypothetical protein